MLGNPFNYALSDKYSLEHQDGIEPPTRRLQIGRSTTELLKLKTY